MHLTLCFIGETKTPTKASDAMDEIFQDPFTLELSYLFMLRKGLMAVGFQPSNELLNLHSNLSAALEDKGFSIEKRAFSAHLTIARNVPAEVSGADLRAISLPKEKILVDRFSLMLSERKKGGVAYTPLYTRYLA
jgi:2'-5' RNA ligase